MFRFAALILLCLLPALSCRSRQPQPSADGTESTPLPEKTVQSAADSGGSSPRTLLEYSSLDTCDGEFEGSYEEEHGEITVRATVLVRLEDCRVSRITLLDSTSLNSEAIEAIPRRIIETQMLPVETVTGASVSSWTIMTATAMALGIDLMEIEE